MLRSPIATPAILRRAVPLAALWCLLPILSGCSGGSNGGPAAFRIDSTSPAIIQANDMNIAWTLTGSGFASGATVTTTYSGVTITGVTVVSGTQITMSLSAAAGTATGSAELIVTNPNAQTASTTVAAVVAVVSLSSMVQPIVSQNCVISGCHISGAPAQGLDLSSGVFRSATVGVASTQVLTLQLVNAGDADASYLIDKIEGTQTVGAKMPSGGGSLTAVEVALIRKWVEAGALNN